MVRSLTHKAKHRDNGRNHQADSQWHPDADGVA